MLFCGAAFCVAAGLLFVCCVRYGFSIGACGVVSCAGVLLTVPLSVVVSAAEAVCSALSVFYILSFAVVSFSFAALLAAFSFSFLLSLS